MKTYHYNDYIGENNTCILCSKTEEQIIQEHYPRFYAKMVRLGKQHLATNEACIDDWVVENYVWDSLLEEAR